MSASAAAKGGRPRGGPPYRTLVELTPLAAALLSDRYGAATLDLVLAPPGARDCLVCCRPLGRPAAVVTVEELPAPTHARMGAVCAACAVRPDVRGLVVAALARDLGLDVAAVLPVAAEGRA